MRTIDELKKDFVSNTLYHYNNLFDLLEDNIPPEQIENLTEDQKDYFKSVLDYETIEFIVLNYKTVIIYDSCGGYIIDVLSIEKLFADSIADYYNWIT